MENKTQFYISGKDKPYNLKEAFGSVYKKIKMIMLNSVNTDKMQKVSIAKEFKLCDASTSESINAYLDSIKKDERSVETFYQDICNAAFIEEPKLMFDEINIGEVNRAVQSFFVSMNIS